MKLVAFVILFFSQCVFADLSPEGTWMVADEDAKIEIYKKGDEFEGKIIWIKEPLNKDGTTKKDIENPDTELRQREIIGMIFLAGFKKKDNEWTGGKIYDSRSGKTYHAWMAMDGADTLKLSGYVGIPLFSKTEKWKRSK